MIFNCKAMNAFKHHSNCEVHNIAEAVGGAGVVKPPWLELPQKGV